MKRFHLIFGIAVVVIFLLTGQYMDRYLNHLQGMADGPRLLYRTRHIFILLAGLLNLGLGAYFTFRTPLAARVMQVIGSTLIVLATVLFIVAFIYEPKMNALETPFSHRAMYSILAGTLLHVLSGIGGKASRPKSSET